MKKMIISTYKRHGEETTKAAVLEQSRMHKKAGKQKNSKNRLSPLSLACTQSTTPFTDSNVFLSLSLSLF